VKLNPEKCVLGVPRHAAGVHCFPSGASSPTPRRSLP
jgi:hypothetical protein